MTHYRPVDQSGNRLPPDELPSHRITHCFRFPCCFCSATPSRMQRYKESQCCIERNIASDYVGEWIFKCRWGRCSYYGMCSHQLVVRFIHFLLTRYDSVPLERLWHQNGVRIMRYHSRSKLCHKCYFFFHVDLSPTLQASRHIIPEPLFR